MCQQFESTNKRKRWENSQIVTRVKGYENWDTKIEIGWSID